MGLRSIPRKAIGGYIKAARIPVDPALKLAGRGRDSEPAVDRAEAAARDVAGAALGDDELRRDASRRRTAADDREQATELRQAAAKRASARKTTAERKRRSTKAAARK